MSTVHRTALSFYENRLERNWTGRTREAAVRVADAVGAFCGAMGDGLAAYRGYEHLRAKGVAHDPALREALKHQ